MHCRYFSCGWVKQVFYHPINHSSNVCFLSTKVLPSMSLSSKPYEVWIAVEKDQEAKSGGTILGAYCTCPAG